MYCHVSLSAFTHRGMTSHWRMAKTGACNPRAWIVGADDGTQYSASADTVVIQSDDDDHDVVVLGAGRTLSDVCNTLQEMRPGRRLQPRARRGSPAP